MPLFYVLIPSQPSFDFGAIITTGLMLIFKIQVEYINENLRTSTQNKLRWRTENSRGENELT
jgi:hypothetical protein